MKLLVPTSILFSLVAAGCSPVDSANNAAQGQPPAQVVVVPVARDRVEEALSLVGSMTANEQVELISETDGKVVEINFDEGQPVEKGQLLVRLDDTKLAASLAEAEANYALSENNLERARDLLKEQLISSSEFDQTSAAFAANDAAVNLRKRQLADTKITAPFGGVVGARMISPGQVVTRSTTLTWLVDLDPLKVEINVPERFLRQVLPGQEIELKVTAFPDEAFTGKVFFVSPYVDPGSRTALIKAEVANPDHQLKPGMFAGLDLTLQVRTNAIVIPEVAINQVLEGGRATVMIVNAENQAEIRSVRVGLRTAGRVEIIEGLEVGEKVIVEGLQKIGPGMPVVLAPESSSEHYNTKPATGGNPS